MSTFSGSDRGVSGQHTADPWRHPDHRNADHLGHGGGQFGHGVDQFDGRSGEFDHHAMFDGHAVSAQQRLSSTRPQSGAQTLRTAGGRGSLRRLQTRLRLDLLLGIGLVIAGVVFVMSSRGTPSTVQSTDLQAQVNSPGDEAPVADASPADAPLLLSDEALVAVSLEPGTFPPAMVAGDVVQVVVTPTFDGGGEVRILESKPVVHRIDPPGELESKWIVTLRAPAVVARAIAASGPVHLSVLGGQS